MVSILRAARQARDFLNARIYRPSHLRIGVLDYFDLRTPPDQMPPNARYLQAAMAWLCHAQDATPDGGIAARYRLDRGWTASYPETTGYIIPTFFNYAAFTQNPSYHSRAIRMADWLLRIQMDSGAFPGHTLDCKPVPRVFNTGQVILGLLHAYQETRNEQYLEASIRAGDWLVSVQESDGSWLRHTFNDRVHAYHTCVAWPMILLASLTGKANYRQAAVANLDWALSCQTETGWFHHNGFKDDRFPYLHTIAYTITGLLESAYLLQPEAPFKSRFFLAAVRASEALLHRFEVRRYMAAQFDQNWKSPARFSCLTGNSQMAYNWLRIYEGIRDPRYLNGAVKLNEFVKSTQDLRSRNPGIRGGIKGSHPIWGRYIRYSYPNWAAKFFVDAIMLEEKVVTSLYQSQEMHEHSHSR